MAETAHTQRSLVSIEGVRSGVFILSGQPSSGLIDTGNFFTAQDFGQAGVDAGKSVNYGQGVMRDIALQMVGIEAENTYRVNGVDGYLMRGDPEYDLYYRIFYLMNNPTLIKQGSRNRLLLGTQLVHDVWSAGEGRISSENLPTLGKVGHRVVSMLFTDPAQD